MRSLLTSHTLAGPKDSFFKAKAKQVTRCSLKVCLNERLISYSTLKDGKEHSTDCLPQRSMAVGRGRNRDTFKLLGGTDVRLQTAEVTSQDHRSNAQKPFKV